MICLNASTGLALKDLVLNLVAKVYETESISLKRIALTRGLVSSICMSTTLNLHCQWVRIKSNITTFTVVLPLNSICFELSKLKESVMVSVPKIEERKRDIEY